MNTINNKIKIFKKKSFVNERNNINRLNLKNLSKRPSFNSQIIKDKKVSLIKNIKKISLRNIISKRNISKNSKTYIEKKNVKNDSMNALKPNVHINERNKKLVTLKSKNNNSKNKTLIFSNTFLNITNNYKKLKNKNDNLTKKNSSSELNSFFKYNNSNCNTTCNTHNNSNIENISFHKNFLLKKQKEDELKKKIIKNKVNRKIYYEGMSKMFKSFDDLEQEKQIDNSKEYIDDILNNLLLDEKESKIKIDNTLFDRQPNINNKMRAILIDWLIEVHLKFNFTQETLFLTVFIIDAYLSYQKIERYNFQLLGVSALFIASKENEIYFKKLKEYSYITDNTYSEEEIKKMEFNILNTLNFNILIPTSITFYDILSCKFNIKENDKAYKFGQILIEAFLLDDKCLKYSYSTIACSCLYIVMKYFKISNYKDCYNNKFSTIKPINEFKEKMLRDNNYHTYIIKECAKDICNSFGILKENYKSIVYKYSNKNYENIASLLFRH
jgi:hypothetical protein